MTPPAALLAIALACLQALATPPRIALVSRDGATSGCQCACDVRLWQAALGEEPAIIPHARFDATYIRSFSPLHPTRQDIVIIRENDDTLPRKFGVSLHAISDDWTTQRIWDGQDASVQFVHEGSVFLQLVSRDGSISLARLASDESRPVQLTHRFHYHQGLDSTGRFHLVGSTPNDAGGLYDALLDTVTPLNIPHPIRPRRDTTAVISQDQRYLAIHEVPNPAQLHKPSVNVNVPTFGCVTVFDLTTRAKHRVPVTVFTYFGSGLKHLIGPNLTFDDQGRLYYDSAHEILASGVQSLRRYNFDPNTAESTPADDTAPRPKAWPIPKFPAFFQRYLPGVLPPTDRRDLAECFLAFMKVDLPKPIDWWRISIAFGEDDMRFLFKSRDQGFQDTFFYADMDANTLTRIPAPPELQRENALEILFLPDP